MCLFIYIKKLATLSKYMYWIHFFYHSQGSNWPQYWQHYIPVARLAYQCAKALPQCGMEAEGGTKVCCVSSLVFDMELVPLWISLAGLLAGQHVNCRFKKPFLYLYFGKEWGTDRNGFKCVKGIDHQKINIQMLLRIHASAKNRAPA